MSYTIAKCSRCHESNSICTSKMTSCGTCSERTSLCVNCNIACKCGVIACMECFTKSHAITCYNKRHCLSKWNPMLLWTCSCHDLLRETDYHRQMACDLCSKKKLCEKGATDCDCNLTLCNGCLLAHDCSYDVEFEKLYLNYKCNFRPHNRADLERL